MHALTTCLGQNIKLLRKLKGASQSGLGALVGATRSQIASYESGAIEPRFRILLSLSDLFHISIEDLLSEDLSERPPMFASIDHEMNEHEREVLVELRDLIRKTQEMEKILEGYRTFYVMREDIGTPVAKEADHAMGNLFDLLDSLIETNWTLISTLTGEEE